MSTSSEDAVQRDRLGRALAGCLKNLRRSAGIAQERLAYESGVDRGYMGALERGRHSPSIQTIYKLLPVLKISFVEFAAEFDACYRKEARRKPRAKTQLDPAGRSPSELAER